MIASPLEIFRFTENKYEEPLKYLIDLCKSRDIGEIILGLPKHMNGDEGEKAILSREFKKSIEENINVPVILVDERWTTKIAQNRLIDADLSRNKRKKIIDKIAAVVILQGYLDRK